MQCKAIPRACMYIITPTCLLACPLTLKITLHQQKLLGTEAAKRQSGGEEGAGAAGCGLTASMCWGEAAAEEIATEDAAAAAEQFKLLLAEEKNARALLEEV